MLHISGQSILKWSFILVCLVSRFSKKHHSKKHSVSTMMTDKYICISFRVSQLQTLCRVSGTDTTVPLCREADSLCCTNVDISQRQHQCYWNSDRFSGYKVSSTQTFSHNYTNDSVKKYHLDIIWDQREQEKTYLAFEFMRKDLNIMQRLSSCFIYRELYGFYFNMRIFKVSFLSYSHYRKNLALGDPRFHLWSPFWTEKDKRTIRKLASFQQNDMTLRGEFHGLTLVSGLFLFNYFMAFNPFLPTIILWKNANRADDLMRWHYTETLRKG